MDYYAYLNNTAHYSANKYTVIGGCLLLLCVISIWLIKRFHGKRFHRIFNVPRGYALIGLDLGKARRNRIKPLFLSCHNVTGVPDAVFLNRFKRKGIVGEVKSRNYKNQLSNYELYQVTLYMGLMKDKYRLRSIRCAIRFRDRLIPVEFNDALYKHLLELRNEIIQSRNGWFPVDSRPLAQRRQPQNQVMV